MQLAILQKYAVAVSFPKPNLPNLCVPQSVLNKWVFYSISCLFIQSSQHQYLGVYNVFGLWADHTIYDQFIPLINTSFDEHLIHSQIRWTSALDEVRNVTKERGNSRRGFDLKLVISQEEQIFQFPLYK